MADTSMARPWTSRDLAILRKSAFDRVPTSELAVILDRSEAAVRVRRSALKLPPPCGRERHIVCGGVSPISVATIKQTVAKHFDIPAEVMTSPSRKREDARPRQVAMFFARRVGRKSYPQIGAMFGGRDHTTALHAVRQVERLKSEDHSLKDDVATIFSQLKSAPAVDKSLPIVADAMDERA